MDRDAEIPNVAFISRAQKRDPDPDHEQDPVETIDLLPIPHISEE
jgi:hypothetical protein